MRHNIVLCTLAYNEEDIVGYAVDYWKALGVSKAIVYNNCSTDSTVEQLKSYGDWIEIRDFKTEGQNDVVQAQIKNGIINEFKGKDVWLVVCDFDEWLYSKDIDSVIDKMEEGGYTCLGTQWYGICNDSTPPYQNGVLLHTQSTKLYKQYINHMPQFKDLGKFMLINPNKIEAMNWSVGNHICHPTGDFKLYIATHDEAFAIHLNKGLSEDYFVAKRKRMGANLSVTNRMYNMCYEYNKSEEESRKEYRAYQEKSFNINEKSPSKFGF